MKKFIVGLVLILSVWSTTPVVHAGFFDSFSGALNGISNVIGGVGNVVGNIGGLVNGFGNGGGGNVGVRVNSGGINVNLGGGGGGQTTQYAVNSTNFSSGNSVVIMQDFDSIFDQVNTGTGVTPSGKFELPEPGKFNTIGQNTSLRQYILNVLNFTLTFLGLIAVAMVIYAGYLYVASAGEDSNIEKSKKILIYAVIGILVVLASFAIVNTVIKNAGVGTGDRDGVSNQSTNGTNTNGEVNTTSGDGNSLITDGANGDTITTSDGTVINLNGDNAAGNVTQSLSSLIQLSGEGVSDFGATVMATPEAARNGITFSLNTQALVVIDFGDRTQAVLDTTLDTTATVTHQFGQEKTYNIRGVVKTSDGKQIATQKALTVGGTNAQFSANKSQLLVEEKVALDASASNVTIGSIKSFEWTCESDAGGCFEENFGQDLEVSFSEPGEYKVTLKIENVVGSSDTFTKTFQVIGNKPEAEFSFEATGNPLKPAEMKFNAGQSKNVLGINQSLTYYWSFDENIQQVNTPEITYEFKSVGDKEVILVVVESRGGLILKSEPFVLTVPIKTTIPIDFDVN